MYKDLLNKIKEYDNITIFRHIRPDGDAYFSSIALYTFLKDNFKNKKIKLCGYEAYDHFSIIQNVSDSFINDSLAIVCDTALIERCDDKRFINAQYVVKIDHHPGLENYGDLNIVKDDNAATCEILADIFFSKEFKNYKISKKVCKYLYCGLITDTLNFKTVNTKSHTLLMASKLIEKGDLDVSDLYEWLMNIDLKTFKILSKVRNELVVKENFGYIILDQKKIKSLKMSAIELKNYITEIGSINDLNIWAFAVEVKPNHYDCSYRSKRAYVINEICRKYGGGGHKNASATRDLSLSQQKDIFKELIELSTK